jgi:hypothetical protein
MLKIAYFIVVMTGLSLIIGLWPSADAILIALPVMYLICSLLLRLVLPTGRRRA